MAHISMAQKLDLAQLIRLGYDQNLDLAISLRKIDLEKSLVNTAYDMPKTKLDLQVGNIQTPFETDYLLSVLQSTELPKVFKARKAYNESLVRLGEMDLEVQKNEYRFGVANIYYQLYYFQQLTDLIKAENLKLQDLEKVYRRRQEVGENDGSEASNIQLRILENEVKLKNIIGQKTDLEGKLKFLLNISKLPEIAFFGAQGDFLQSSTSSNSKIKMQELHIESAQFATKNELNKLLPGLTFGVTNQSMMGSWRQFIGLAGLEIPVFVKGQKARVEASRINTIIQEQELGKIKQLLDNEILTQQTSLLNVQSSIEMLNNNIIQASEKVMDIYMKKYIAGQIDYFDWYLSYSQNVNYKMELLNLEKSKNLIISNINYLIGNE